MASAATATTQPHHSLLLLCWNCLSSTPNALKNPGHATIFPDLDTMDAIFSASDIKFGSGVLEAMLSKVPPSRTLFQSLPTDFKKVWAVYAVVLVKSARRPKICIGSGLNTDAGVSKRMKQYETLTNLPRGVKEAMDDGFSILHKGLLCWTKVPSSSETVSLRSLFLIIETVLALVFWSMQSRTKDYGMPHLCPWDIEVLDYDGCCTHLSIYEQIHGLQPGLTADQAAELEVQRKERAKAMGPVYQGELDPVQRTLWKTIEGLTSLQRHSERERVRPIWTPSGSV